MAAPGLRTRSQKSVPRARRDLSDEKPFGDAKRPRITHASPLSLLGEHDLPVLSGPAAVIVRAQLGITQLPRRGLRAIETGAIVAGRFIESRSRDRTFPEADNPSIKTLGLTSTTGRAIL